MWTEKQVEGGWGWGCGRCSDNTFRKGKREQQLKGSVA